MMRDELQQGPTVTPLMSAHMTPQVSQAHLDANFWRRITAGIAALNHQNIWIGSEVLVECVEHVLPRLMQSQRAASSDPSSAPNLENLVALSRQRWTRQATSAELLGAYESASVSYLHLCRECDLAVDQVAASETFNSLEAAKGSLPPVDASKRPVGAATMSISLILPAYNEADIIGTTIEATAKAASQFCPNFEIIVVNDGSADATGSIIDAWARRDASVVPLHHKVNQGYGGALLSGFAAARGKLLFFMDSDGQFAIDDIEKLLEVMTQHPDAVALGYREKRRDSWFRRLNAWGWKQLVGVMLGLHDVRDIDCAFKLFPTHLVWASQVTSRGAMVNTELLTKLQRMGIPMIQVPVGHYPRQMGKATGANLRVIARAFKELLRLRARLHRWQMPAELVRVRAKTPVALRLFED